MSLDNTAVLIVEDEPFVALDLAMSVEDAGGTVVGPAATLEAALLLAGCALGGAILDFYLPDGDVSPVLDELLARDVPVVLQTGGELPKRVREGYPDLLVLPKPNNSSRLVAHLCQRLKKNNTRL